MTPRACAVIAAKRMRAEFERVFEECEPQFPPSYNRTALKATILDHVSRAMFVASGRMESYDADDADAG